MVKKYIKRFNVFVQSNEQYPVITGIASGLYPLGYYYNANFTLANSWSQLAFFLTLFLIIPVIISYVVHTVIKKTDLFRNYSKPFSSVFNLSWFGFLVLTITKGLSLKPLFVVLFLALCLGVFLRNHLNKIVVIQLFLAAFVILKLIPELYYQISYSNDWQEQQDNIEKVVFKKRPNIYVIQPDGYANFYELNKEPYNFDNVDFEQFLNTNHFKLYKHFRSNYFSTLSSNSSMFSMKHHYFNKQEKFFTEVYYARDVIVGDNPVLSILKNNNYKTFLMLHKPYLLANRAESGYDYCNIDYNEVPFLSTGFEVEKDINYELKSIIKSNNKTSNFFFIEQLSPGHISTHKNTSRGKLKERDIYLESLNKANIWLKKIITLIGKNDKNALVIIVADHGGFVGLDYTLQSLVKQDNPDLIKSVFSAALAIKWPNKESPPYDFKLKTNVNLFRILFTYLSGDESYLKHLQNDKSYSIIQEKAPSGIYEVLDENGNMVFKKFIDK